MESLYWFLISLVFVAIIASAVQWIRFLYRWRVGRDHPSNLVPMQAKEAPFWSAADFLIMFGLLLIGIMLFRPAIAGLDWEQFKWLTRGDERLQKLIQSLSVTSCASVMASAITIAWLSVRYWQGIGMVRYAPQASQIRLGFKAALWLLPPVGLLSAAVAFLVPYEHPVLDALSKSPTLPIFCMMFVGTAIIAPFSEEFMFRVLLQGGLQRLAEGPLPAEQLHAVEQTAARSDDSDEDENPYRPVLLEQTEESENQLSSQLSRQESGESEPAIEPQRRWNPKYYWPIVVTSLVFALMHAGQGAAPIPLFVLSLGLGYLYRQTGRMTAPLVVHFVLNTTTLCVEFARFAATP